MRGVKEMDIREMLQKQLLLLLERSQKTKNVKDLCRLNDEICRIVNAIRS